MNDTLRRFGAPLLVTCLAMTASASSRAAAPSKGSATPTATKAKAKPLPVKKHTKKRGITKWETSIPSRADRMRAGMEVVADTPWATVSVRHPVSTTNHSGPYVAAIGDRAALSFVDPQFVDARSGWASWRRPGGVNLPGGPGSSDAFDGLTCLLLGIACDDDDDGAGDDVDLDLWVNASAGHHYVAVCRVKFEDSVGQLDIVGTSTMSVQIDHTGQPSTTVSFVIDASDAGWYSIAIASAESWSTTGCTIDEL
jgi:hypothetical protein